MDVSTAPHDHSEPNPAKAGPQSQPGHDSSAKPGGFAPMSRSSPRRHGIMMGLATTASVAISFCCLLSVANMLGTGRPVLNGSLAIIALGAGLYVGLRCWKAPPTQARGRCLDCGRELMSYETACSLCGRKVTPSAKDA